MNGGLRVLHDQVANSIQQWLTHDRGGDLVQRERRDLVKVNEEQIVLLADPDLGELVRDRDQRQFGAAFGAHVVEDRVLRVAVLLFDERVRVDVRVDRTRTDQRDRDLVLDA